MGVEDSIGSRSILEREITTQKPKKYESKVSGNSSAEEWSILAVMLIILLTGWAILIILVLRSGPPQNGDAPALVNCPAGQCATNIYNGEKRCPQATGTIVSDAGVEVCNSTNRCDNNTTPYALLSDSSTSFDGLCEKGINCRCMRYPQCAEYITSLFRATDGNPYGGVPGTRTKFEQYASFKDPTTGITSINPPFAYTDISTTFCTVPINWLPRSTPGCNFVENMDAEAITRCMGGTQGCYGTTFNPCYQGTLAFITPQSDGFNSSMVERTPLGCVTAPECPCGTVAVYDTSLGSRICTKIWG